jgi:hypothetical protein
MTTQINPDLITDDMMYENPVDLRTHDGIPLMEHLKDSKLWGDIRRAAKTNKTLQHALDRVIIIYQLSKDNGTK